MHFAWRAPSCGPGGRVCSYELQIDGLEPFVVNGSWEPLVNEAKRQLSNGSLRIVVRRLDDGSIVLDWSELDVVPENE